MSQQLKILLPCIARYEKQIAELFHAHPYSFLFRDLLGGPLTLIRGLDVAPGVDRFYRKDCLCDLCDLCK